MYKSTYEKITSPILNHKYGERILKIMNTFTTNVAYIIYPVFLISLAYNKDIRFWKLLIIPGISFVLVSIFRNHSNFPRPYEKYDINPIIKKDSKGKSFPSRHVFSIFVIGSSIYYISVAIGIILMVLGLILAIVRVLGGVHFPRDVVFGALLGILASFIGRNITLF